MAINKVQTQSGDVLLDLTGDTVTASDIVSGKTAHDRSGVQITGTFTGQEKTATENGEVTPDTGKYLSKVTVNVAAGSQDPDGIITALTDNSVSVGISGATQLSQETITDENGAFCDITVYKVSAGVTARASSSSPVFAELYYTDGSGTYQTESVTGGTFNITLKSGYIKVKAN